MSYLDALRKNTRHPEPEPAAITIGGPDTTTPAARRALNGIERRLADAVEGTRNGLLNWAAYTTGRYHAAGTLTHQDAKDAIYRAAYTCGLQEPEVTNTFNSGWTAGLQHPLAPLESHAAKLSPYTAAPPPNEPDAETTGLPQPLDWHELWADDTEDEWILEPLIPARRLVALFSAPKVGKSLLMLELAANIATGTPSLGDDRNPHPPRTVLYVDYENDPRGDIRTRLQAMGRTPHQLDQLRYLSYPVLGGLDTYPGAAVLIACVDEYQPELVVIDTVSRAVAGEENDNDTWLNFYRMAGLALKQRGVACVRLDHSGKDEEKGMRGGSAKYGDVDAVWHMRTNTDDGSFTLKCTHRRMRIVDDHLTIIRHEDPLRHTVTTASSFALAVERCIEILDELGLPDDAGRPTVKAALGREGHLDGPGRIKEKVYVAAIDKRKNRPDPFGE